MLTGRRTCGSRLRQWWREWRRGASASTVPPPRAGAFSPIQVLEPLVVVSTSRRGFSTPTVCPSPACAPALHACARRVGGAGGRRRRYVWVCSLRSDVGDHRPTSGTLGVPSFTLQRSREYGFLPALNSAARFPRKVCRVSIASLSRARAGAGGRARSLRMVSQDGRDGHGSEHGRL